MLDQIEVIDQTEATGSSLPAITADSLPAAAAVKVKKPRKPRTKTVPPEYLERVKAAVSAALKQDWQLRKALERAEQSARDSRALVLGRVALAVSAWEQVHEATAFALNRTRSLTVAVSPAADSQPLPVPTNDLGEKV